MMHVYKFVGRARRWQNTLGYGYNRRRDGTATEAKEWAHEEVMNYSHLPGS